MNRSQQFPPFSEIFVPFLILGALGLGGLTLVITQTLPTLLPRWLFFFLSTLGVTGIALPIVYFLNWRFSSSNSLPSTGTLVREALWMGIIFDLLAWLQLERVLTLTLGMILFLGVFILEFSLRLIERAQWRPHDTPHDS
ncbi:hypothetical protein QYE77_00360 [Thermanaerothrix sp. 4228-RoL]|uniref:Uncharacterized protein n=1 Tax=Thermanaerothrix solaris TaxID=3058434 RepID=A0ABU3NKG0_9CHLR|nr:hypothetical protein [Thermanaerothrix sp. 4228-RoL]MDT8896703.1 hypothetical protein [Thermanaerothrix sp. 4228-RoL]